MSTNDLYLEIFREVLSTLAGVDLKELMDSICYRALCRIRNIIRDETLSDPECFRQIEAVISTFEQLGSGGGFRHDF